MNDCVLRDLVVTVGHSLHHAHNVRFKILKANRSEDLLHAFGSLKELLIVKLSYLFSYWQFLNACEAFEHPQQMLGLGGSSYMV